jgi:hypothetical protein
MDRNILEGNRITPYFHVVANQRRRKKMIHGLDGLDGPKTDIKGVFKIANDYYKDIFK